MAVELNHRITDRRRFTVREFERMIRARVFGDDERIELLDGEIVEMTPIEIRHAAGVRHTYTLFLRLAPAEVVVDVQNPVRLGSHSRPQPDVALLRGPLDRYRARLPTVEDIFLLVEVADTSLRKDRRVKMPLYAQTGVPESWLVDLRAATITVYREPSADGYRVVQTFRRGDTIAPLAFPDWAFTVDEILA